jgi:hypothetical protein
MTAQAMAENSSGQFKESWPFDLAGAIAKEPAAAMQGTSAQAQS